VIPVVAPVVPPARHYAHIWDGVDNNILLGMGAKSAQTYNVMHRRLRKWFDAAKHDIDANAATEDDNLVLEALSSWKKMAIPRKGLLVKYCITTTTPGPEIVTWLSNRWPLAPEIDENLRCVRVQSVLLTWQGPWGVITEFPDTLHRGTLKDVGIWLRDQE
jgi:hypothetical protein